MKSDFKIEIYKLGKRRRKMPIRAIKNSIKNGKKEAVNLNQIIKELTADHPLYIKPIAPAQLKRLVINIINKHGVPFTDSTPAPTQSEGLAASKLAISLMKADLNKLNDIELQQCKEIMDVEFEKKRVKKEDPQFEYDVKKEFGPPVAPSDWDSDSSGKEDEKKAKTMKESKPAEIDSKSSKIPVAQPVAPTVTSTPPVPTAAPTNNTTAPAVISSSLTSLAGLPSLLTPKPNLTDLKPLSPNAGLTSPSLLTQPNPRSPIPARIPGALRRTGEKSPEQGTFPKKDISSVVEIKQSTPAPAVALGANSLGTSNNSAKTEIQTQKAETAVEKKVDKGKPAISKSNNGSISDFEEDFIISDLEKEDEEFTKMLQKTKKDVSKSEVKPIAVSVEQRPTVVPAKDSFAGNVSAPKSEEKKEGSAKTNDFKPPATAKVAFSDQKENPKPELTETAAKPVTQVLNDLKAPIPTAAPKLAPLSGSGLSSIANLPPLTNPMFAKNAAEIEKLKASLTPKKAAETNDFGAGHTDSEDGEIVFSDDGLSLGSVDLGPDAF